MSTSYTIELDSTFRNRNAEPTPTEFSSLAASSASATKFDDPVCNSMPQEFWTASQFNSAVEGLSVACIVVAAKSSERIVVLSRNVEFQRRPNYYRGAILSFSNSKVQRKIVSSLVLPTRDCRFEVDLPIDNYLDTNVDLIEPSDFAFGSGTGYEIFVPGGVPIDNYYDGYLLYKETNQTSAVITRYASQIAYISSTTWVAAANNSYSIRRELPITSSVANPALSTTTRVRLVISNNKLDNANLAHFVRNTSIKYGNLENANANIIPRIVAWDPVNRFATVSPPFGQVPPFGTFLEVLPISSDNSVSFTNIHYTFDKNMQFLVSLVSLTMPTRSNVLQYPYVYVGLTSARKYTSKNILVSNNNNSANAQFRATFSAFDKSREFCKLTGDDVEHVVQIQPDYEIILRIFLPDGSAPVYTETEKYSPAAPNPLVQSSASFSIRPINSLGVAGRNRLVQVPFAAAL